MTDSSAWTPFDEQSFANKHKPPVPESSFYGFTLLGLCLVWVAYRKWFNSRAR